ncbi:MAG TPA: energy transducer TonB [Bacteroidales bacterium]|nr:energy transducer TonB [Bacteroidales bacterium]HOU97476.1 energy transducer TonB [Bacteroidales bacterium]
MELKKNPEADLEKKRNLFFQIGLTVTLALILFAFELKIMPSDENTFVAENTGKIEEEIVPITKQEELKTPPPPPPAVTDVLEIVEDNKELTNEVKVENTEADANTQIQAPIEVQQEEENEEVVNFYVIEEKPEFPGGEAAMFQWIAKNVKYPEIAKENGVQGKVFVQFVIGKEGKVTDVQVVRGVDPSLDKEAVRIIQSMPAWKPGKQRGKPVKVSFQLPINFKLS